jgi:NAD-dependent aldehyde dehydrogenases
MQDAAKSNLKKVSLELGGKSPLIIFKDADGLYLNITLSLYHSLTTSFSQFKICVYITVPVKCLCSTDRTGVILFQLTRQWSLHIRLSSSTKAKCAVLAPEHLCTRISMMSSSRSL